MPDCRISVVSDRNYPVFKHDCLAVLVTVAGILLLGIIERSSLLSHSQYEEMSSPPKVTIKGL